MLLKKKSLIVTFVSGFILSCVLFIELKNEESKISYRYSLGRLNAKIYEKYIEVSGLAAKTEDAGALKGKNIVCGIIKNRGNKDISGLLLKIKLFDRDGAVIYETIFDPREPALGSGIIPEVSIPYISTHTKIITKKGDLVPFKKILAGCPPEIAFSINNASGFSKDRGKWSGKLGYELVSIELYDPGA
ncbi:MAG: hypothetical protein NTZ95_06000 [Candidatus Omnitrophica bacterium]|nr:hypothetical protein [Candidatus Omnitrophota bacterium]